MRRFGPVNVAVCAVRVDTDLKTALVNGSLIRPCFSTLRAASLSDDSSDKRLVQLCDRLPQGLETFSIEKRRR